jgi:hypothetical protein
MNSKDTGPDERGRILELQRQIDELRKVVGNVAQASALENVVQQGFDRLSSQLEPLRDIGPTREFPIPADMQKHVEILKAIKHPKWRGTEFAADIPTYDDNCSRSG